MENADIDIDNLIQKLLTTKKAQSIDNQSLTQTEIKYLCNRVKEILLSQPTLLQLETPIKICGAIFGYYQDLLRIFELGGFPPESNYLFLGNYVDREKQGIETICLLFAYKIKYPDKVFLLRGNHESSSINRIYGFYDECKKRYNIKLWKMFNDAFNFLPIAAILNDKIFCVHSGLSPDLNNLDQIAEIPRPTDVPDTGLLWDLLWSDPDRNFKGWVDTGVASYYNFGPDVVESFLIKHDMQLICRSHQVVEEGYEFFAENGLVTLFSAPDYCGEFGNSGAIMNVDESLKYSFSVLKPNSKTNK